MPRVVVGAALVAAREVAAAPLDVDKKAHQADVVGARLRAGAVVEGAVGAVRARRPPQAGVRPVPRRVQVARRRVLPRPVEGEHLLLVRVRVVVATRHDVLPVPELLAAVLRVRQDGRRAGVAAHLGADAVPAQGGHGQAARVAPAARQVPLVVPVGPEAGDEPGVAQVRQAAPVVPRRQDGVLPDLAHAPEGVGVPGAAEGAARPGRAVPQAAGGDGPVP